MAKTTERRNLDRRADLQAWYIDSLRPKLEDAATAGTVPATSVASLDRDLRKLLELPETGAT
ncbi:MAG: hypothetical protein C5B48_09605 [Candidatus Rokuibacteriota bacterium]|nr:MAG: hypothetical protein C5B48_09605 [Candidatus Rokubacteria bacterium]